ncbi:MAG: hypothetical protein RIQ93_1000 [Verrucomicrobiota bacterium]|jgi:CheY-like chemotaxis protein
MNLPPPGLAEPKFLLVDENSESRFLLARTLARKFADAVILECHTAEEGFQLARTENVSAIVCHRTIDLSGAELVRGFRAMRPGLPIMLVSGRDRKSEAAEAGATCFLPYDEWLRIGSVMKSMLSREAGLGTEQDRAQATSTTRGPLV